MNYIQFTSIDEINGNCNGNNVFIERLKSIRKCFTALLRCIKNVKHDIYISMHPIQYLKFIFRWQKQ